MNNKKFCLVRVHDIGPTVGHTDLSEGHVALKWFEHKLSANLKSLSKTFSSYSNLLFQTFRSD